MEFTEGSILSHRQKVKNMKRKYFPMMEYLIKKTKDKKLTQIYKHLNQNENRLSSKCLEKLEIILDNMYKKIYRDHDKSKCSEQKSCLHVDKEKVVPDIDETNTKSRVKEVKRRRWDIKPCDTESEVNQCEKRNTDGDGNEMVTVDFALDEDHIIATKDLCYPKNKMTPTVNNTVLNTSTIPENKIKSETYGPSSPIKIDNNGDPEVEVIASVSGLNSAKRGIAKTPFATMKELKGSSLHNQVRSDHMMLNSRLAHLKRGTIIDLGRNNEMSKQKYIIKHSLSERGSAPIKICTTSKNILSPVKKDTQLPFELNPSSCKQLIDLINDKNYEIVQSAVNQALHPKPDLDNTQDKYRNESVVNKFSDKTISNNCIFSMPRVPFHPVSEERQLSTSLSKVECSYNMSLPQPTYNWNTAYPSRYLQPNPYAQTLSQNVMSHVIENHNNNHLPTTFPSHTVTSSHNLKPYSNVIQGIPYYPRHEGPSGNMNISPVLRANNYTSYSHPFQNFNNSLYGHMYKRNESVEQRDNISLQLNSTFPRDLTCYSNKSELNYKFCRDPRLLSRQSDKYINARDHQYHRYSSAAEKRYNTFTHCNFTIHENQSRSKLSRNRTIHESTSERLSKCDAYEHHPRHMKTYYNCQVGKPEDSNMRSYNTNLYNSPRGIRPQLTTCTTYNNSDKIPSKSNSQRNENCNTISKDKTTDKIVNNFGRCNSNSKKTQNYKEAYVEKEMDNKVNNESIRKRNSLGFADDKNNEHFYDKWSNNENIGDYCIQKRRHSAQPDDAIKNSRIQTESNCNITDDDVTCTDEVGNISAGVKPSLPCGSVKETGDNSEESINFNRKKYARGHIRVLYSSNSDSTVSKTINDTPDHDTTINVNDNIQGTKTSSLKTKHYKDNSKARKTNESLKGGIAKANVQRNARNIHIEQFKESVNENGNQEVEEEATSNINITQDITDDSHEEDSKCESNRFADDNLVNTLRDNVDRNAIVNTNITEDNTNNILSMKGKDKSFSNEEAIVNEEPIKLKEKIERGWELDLNYDGINSLPQYVDLIKFRGMRFCRIEEDLKKYIKENCIMTRRKTKTRIKKKALNINLPSHNSLADQVVSFSPPYANRDLSKIQDRSSIETFSGNNPPPLPAFIQCTNNCRTASTQKVSENALTDKHNIQIDYVISVLWHNINKSSVNIDDVCKNIAKALMTAIDWNDVPLSPDMKSSAENLKVDKRDFSTSERKKNVPFDGRPLVIKSKHV